MGTVLAANEAVSERGVINLAHVSPFRLGALDVSPPTRQIARDGQSETLEPRVMQVLVALKEADGAVVTRDELIARCWEGRVVGDNAIQRTISRLRDIAAGLGEGCFRLETVSKVGYRLIAGEQFPAADVKDPLPRTARGWPAAAAVAVVTVMLVAAAVIWMQRAGPGATSVAVISGPGEASTDLAGGVAVDLARLAASRSGGPTFAAGGHADFVLKLAQRGAGAGLRADASVSRNGAADLVWSASFAGIGDPAILRQRIAYDASRIIACALEAVPDAQRADGTLLRLLFTACETLGDEVDDQAVMAWRHVVARDPKNVTALATLARLEADLGTSGQTEEPGHKIRAEALTDLGRLRRLDPNASLGFAAEAMLLPPSRYGEKLATVEHGLAADPENAFLHRLKSLYLRDVGRSDSAIESTRRAVALDPGSPIAHEGLITALAYGGFAEEARAEISATRRLWPESRILREVEFRFEFRFGDAQRLLNAIDRGTALPNSPWTVQNGPNRAFLLARAQPTPANIEAASAIALKFAAPPQVSLQSLAALGRVDQAYALVSDAQHVARLRDQNTEILFRANMRPFVLDRRFMALADQLGLVAYWQSQKRWPDFCDDKDLPYDCKEEARRIHPAPI